jgi:predicted amidohydrolase
MPSRSELEKLAVPFGQGRTFEFFRQLAAQGNGAVVFGYPELDGGRVFNSSACILPDGQMHRYRKMHLFDREKSWFDTADTGFSVFSFRGATIGMLICFDWIFPEAWRSLMLQGADIIAHPSDLVTHYCQSSMVTRAVENAFFTITCNRTGADRVGDEEISFTGRSRIVDPRGKVLAESGAEEDRLMLVDIDPTRARDKHFTAQNDLIADRRSEFYRD